MLRGSLITAGLLTIAAVAHAQQDGSGDGAETREKPRGLFSGQIYRIEQERRERRQRLERALRPVTRAGERIRGTLERARQRQEEQAAPPESPLEAVQDRLAGADRFARERLLPHVAEMGAEAFEYLVEGRESLDRPSAPAKTLEEELTRRFFDPQTRENAESVKRAIKDNQETLGEIVDPSLRSQFEQGAQKSLKYLGSDQLSEDLQAIRELQKSLGPPRVNPQTGLPDMTPREQQATMDLLSELLKRRVLNDQPQGSPDGQKNARESAAAKQAREDAEKAAAMRAVLEELARRRARQAPPAPPKAPESAGDDF